MHGSINHCTFGSDRACNPMHGTKREFTSHIRLKWRQNRPKFHPRCLSKHDLLEKRDFHENLIKPMNFNDFWPQDRHQNGSRRAQDGSKRVPKAIISHVDFCLRFCTVLVPIFDPFWEPFGPQDRPKIGPNIRRKNIGKLKPQRLASGYNRKHIEPLTVDGTINGWQNHPWMRALANH